MAESLLKLRDIQVRHGTQSILEIAGLEITAGEVLAVLGPNGAGKTTLLQVMGLLRPPTAGEVYFKGEKAIPANGLAIRRRIATVFQEALLLNATVRENAALGLRLRGVSRGVAEIRLRPWLDRLGIAELAERSARTLSGGEAQRTSLARALVLEPELLLLDEPFAALDPVSREGLLRDFQQIVKETKITTAFVTHDRQEAFALSDRVGVMKQGRLWQIGARDELFHRPKSVAVAEIVGFENRLAAQTCSVDGGYTTLGLAAVNLRARGRFAIGKEVVACIRAEALSLHAGTCASQDVNRIEGRIIEFTPGFGRNRLTLDCGGAVLVGVLEQRESQSLALEPGHAITVYVDAAAVHVIADEQPC